MGDLFAMLYIGLGLICIGTLILIAVRKSKPRFSRAEREGISSQMLIDLTERVTKLEERISLNQRRDIRKEILEGYKALQK